MDLLRELRELTARISGHAAHQGIESAIRHIEVAERHLSEARAGSGDELFNDVIYRTNQAFEGMLKEAYRVLEQEDPGKLRPFDLEQHFARNEVLAKRVQELFANYRREGFYPVLADG